MMNIGNAASRNEIIESGVSVTPRLSTIVWDVYKALPAASIVSLADLGLPYAHAEANLPPNVSLSAFLQIVPVFGIRMLNPRHQANDTKDMEANKIAYAHMSVSPFEYEISRPSPNVIFRSSLRLRYSIPPSASLSSEVRL
jgi:hypothetical protein